MTKKGHRKFWRIETDIFWEKIKVGKNFHGLERCSEIGGNLKQRGNASLALEEDAPVTINPM